MLKADTRPWKKTLGVYAPDVLFMTLSFWLFRGIPLWEAFIGTCIFCLVFGGWQDIRKFVRLRRAEQRRQAAITNSQQVPLAQPQPAPDPTVLPLPLVIFSRPGWLAYLVAPLVAWVIILAFLFFFFWQYQNPLVLLLSSVIVAVPVGIGTALSAYTWIEVGEEGMTTRTLFSRRTVRWHDASLFAIDAIVEPDKTPHHYELSSATAILRWSREQKPSRLTRLSSPFPEYVQQMDGLLMLIAGKTGLPLYDLRDWKLVQPAPGITSRLLQRGRRFFSRRPHQTSQTLDS